MIEVILSNGDRAEAPSPAGALLAARTLFQEAADRSAYGLHGVTASFIVDGRLVREGVRRQSLPTEGTL